ncbi:flagellar hook-length control protein [Mycolicibacterium pulveris]|nr:flagellar hook-length control protein [Mycolicibacterium pulveris]
MDLAEDIAMGRVDVAELRALVAEECRALFGTVVGPADPLWGLQCDVMRQCAALGGMSWEEHAEWAAVFRPADAAEPGVSWIEQVLAEGADDDG